LVGKLRTVHFEKGASASEEKGEEIGHTIKYKRTKKNYKKHQHKKKGKKHTLRHPVSGNLEGDKMVSGESVCLCYDLDGERSWGDEEDRKIQLHVVGHHQKLGGAKEKLGA